MRRRRIISALKTEAEMSSATSSWNIPDSGAFDSVYLEDADGRPVTQPAAAKRLLLAREHASRVLSRRGSSPEARQAAERVLSTACHLFEIKTMLVTAAAGVRLARKARQRKWSYAARVSATPHVLVVDKRKGKKYSGHSIHLAVGEVSASHKLADMEKIPDYASLISTVCPSCGRKRRDD
jgi:hypothetical protein